MAIMIHGKKYITCAERLQMVHESSNEFEMVSSEPVQLGDLWAWRVVIKIAGLQFIGTAQIHLDAKPGSADHTDPMACAETSAIARAIGFAGFGAVEGIASADELVRGQVK